MRSNLDPFNLHEDARLWDALRRSYLVPKASDNGTPAPASRISLDSPVEPDGANLSVGERSLLSLARALVKDSKIVVLDEATYVLYLWAFGGNPNRIVSASVDLETDSKIQDTIQSEFTDRTLLCIAHRLRTILAYDRILVLDNGNIAVRISFTFPFLAAEILRRNLTRRSTSSTSRRASSAACALAALSLLRRSRRPARKHDPWLSSVVSVILIY